MAKFKLQLKGTSAQIAAAKSHLDYMASATMGETDDTIAFEWSDPVPTSKPGISKVAGTMTYKKG